MLTEGKTYPVWANLRDNKLYEFTKHSLLRTYLDTRDIFTYNKLGGLQVKRRVYVSYFKHVLC